LRRTWHDTRDRIIGTTEYAQDTSSETGSGVVDTVQSAASSAKESAMQLPDAARRQAQGAPLVATAVAFGAGFLFAALVPTSRREQELASRFESELGEGASGIKQGVTDMARGVAEHVSGDVQEAGRNVAEHAKDAASEVASNVSNQQG
jgi:hypothetical protein